MTPHLNIKIKTGTGSPIGPPDIQPGHISTSRQPHPPTERVAVLPLRVANVWALAMSRPVAADCLVAAPPLLAADLSNIVAPPMLSGA